MILLKYWKYLIAGLIVLALVAGVKRYGSQQYKSGYLKATAEIEARLAAQSKKQAEVAQQASQNYQEVKTELEQKERIRYVEVQKIIDKPVYIRDCFDADGLQQLNQAITDGNKSTRRPSTALPAIE